MSETDMSALADELRQVVTASQVRTNVNMSQLTTFKVGGPAGIVVDIASVADCLAVLETCSKASVPFRVIGCGSNILAADSGLDCVLMRFGECFAQINIQDDCLFAQAGATNAQVAAAACAAGLSGYEFACGIPGTIGGAAYMNAGAYDGQFADAVVSVTCMDLSGKLVELDASQADFSYRHSAMMDRGLIVLGATLKLKEDDPQSIQARMDDLEQRRSSKQPLELPSAGSTFKRPEGYFAGKLIQDAGLKGYSVGGAMVSTKHCGFVVNANGATAQDVRQLIADVQAKVLATQGVQLEPEVRMWGFED